MSTFQDQLVAAHTDRLQEAGCPPELIEAALRYTSAGESRPTTYANRVPGLTLDQSLHQVDAVIVHSIGRAVVGRDGGETDDQDQAARLVVVEFVTRAPGGFLLPGDDEELPPSERRVQETDRLRVWRGEVGDCYRILSAEGKVANAEHEFLARSALPFVHPEYRPSIDELFGAVTAAYGEQYSHPLADATGVPNGLGELVLGGIREMSVDLESSAFIGGIGRVE